MKRLHDLADFWEQAEREFRANRYDGSRKSGVSVRNRGRGGICLVSVHGINHYSGRGADDRKVADLYTGGLVRTLGFKCNVMTVVNRSRSSEINPHIGETAADKILRRFCEARLLD